LITVVSSVFGGLEQLLSREFGPELVARGKSSGSSDDDEPSLGHQVAASAASGAANGRKLSSTPTFFSQRLKFFSVVSNIIGEIEKHLRRDLTARSKSSGSSSSSLSHDVVSSAVSGGTDGRKSSSLPAINQI
jgi:hypothetical protein